MVIDADYSARPTAGKAAGLCSRFQGLADMTHRSASRIRKELEQLVHSPGPGVSACIVNDGEVCLATAYQVHC
jgi:hypothetical protein